MTNKLKQQKTSQFFLYWHAVYDRHQTYHEDKGLSHFCNLHPSDFFWIRSVPVVLPLGAIENLWENADIESKCL